MQKYFDPKLEKIYYRNGVRPQYLWIHRVLNYKKTNRGDEWYLIKWRDQGYDQATWELEGGEVATQILNWRKECDIFWNLKRTCEGEEEEKARASKKGAGKNQNKLSKRELEALTESESSEENFKSDSRPRTSTA